MTHTERPHSILDAIAAIPAKIRETQALHREIDDRRVKANSHLNAILADADTAEEAKELVNGIVKKEMLMLDAANMFLFGDQKMEPALLSELTLAARYNKYLIESAVPAEKIVDGRIVPVTSGVFHFWTQHYDWGRYTPATESVDVIAFGEKNGLPVIIDGSSAHGKRIENPTTVFVIKRTQEWYDPVARDPIYTIMFTPNGVEWLDKALHENSNKRIKAKS